MSVSILTCLQLGTLSSYIAAHGDVVPTTADHCVELLARANSRTYAARYGTKMAAHAEARLIGRWRAAAGAVTAVEALRLLALLALNTNPDVCEEVEIGILLDAFEIVADTLEGAAATTLRRICQRRAQLGARMSDRGVQGLVLRRMRAASEKIAA